MTPTTSSSPVRTSKLLWPPSTADTSLTPYVISLTLSASLSGLLFGYDTGVISGTLVAIRSDLGHTLSISEKSVITAATTLGALIGALCAPIADRGRKKALAIANVLFIAGALMQAVAGTVGLMVAGRVVVGLGVGLASATAPLYIGELAPRALRGRLVTVNVLTCTGGQVVAYGTFRFSAVIMFFCELTRRYRSDAPKPQGRMAMDGRARRPACDRADSVAQVPA